MRAIVMLALLAPLGAACGPAPVEAPDSMEPTTGSEARTAPLDAAALVGAWTEYWAPVNGDVSTQRYVFSADGRFGWRAAEGAGQRAGTYRVDGAALILDVRRAEGGTGAPGELQLPLGDCPPNDEARALDEDYRCVGIDGDAFWYRGDATQADATLLGGA